MEPNGLKRGPGGVNLTSGINNVKGAVAIKDAVFPSGTIPVKCPGCGRQHKTKGAYIQGHVDADDNFLMWCDDCSRGS